MSRRMALFRLQYARDRLKAARLLLGHRMFHDSSSRSCLAGIYSAWAYLELEEVPCFHFSEVSRHFLQAALGRPGSVGDISTCLIDLIETDREERVGDFFQMDAGSAAYHYQNALRILHAVEESFRSKGIKL